MICRLNDMIYRINDDVYINTDQIVRIVSDDIYMADGSKYSGGKKYVKKAQADTRHDDKRQKGA